MRVKVRYHDVLAQTARATLFLMSEREVWLPRAAYKQGPGRTLIVEQALAEARNLRFSAYVHIPDTLPVTYGQEPINDLKYGSSGGD